MTRTVVDRIHITRNGIKRGIGVDDPKIRAFHETIAREEYDRCHPDDSFDDLKRRARFSKEDQGLLSDWMVAAAVKYSTAHTDLEYRGKKLLAA